MSDIQRITLISDATDEFPKNANNSFKVRLPERLPLRGDRWYASLMTLTVPDQGQSNGVIASDPHTQVVKFSVTYLTRKYILGDYRRVSFKTDEYIVELEDIMIAQHSVTSSRLFWKRLMQEVHNKIIDKLMYEQDYAKPFDVDERPLVSVKKNWMSTMTWKDDALILHAVPKGELLTSDKTKALTSFSHDLGAAEKFGLIEKPKGWAETRMAAHQTPKRYKKETPLNPADRLTPASCRSICLMCPMWITGTKPPGTWCFNPS